MYKISLKEFICTGNFGPVNQKSIRTEVIDLLGKPGFETTLMDGYMTVLCYGRYEFFFYSESGLLSGIQNDQLLADCLNHDEMINYENDNFKVDTWFLEAGKDITCNDLIALFKRENISCRLNTLKGYPELQFESGVSLDFENVDENDLSETNQNETDKIGNRFLIGIRYFVK